MELPPDPFALAWQNLWMGLGGGLLYLLLDVLVLRRNEAFKRGFMFFRIGVGFLCAGVLLGALSWSLFAKANVSASSSVLYGSFAVRALGLVLLIVGLVKMGKRA